MKHRRSVHPGSEKVFTCRSVFLINPRLNELDEDFVDLLRCEDDFPSELPDPKSLYTDFYNKMMDLTANIICTSCGCLEHRKERSNCIPIDHPCFTISTSIHLSCLSVSHRGFLSSTM